MTDRHSGYVVILYDNVRGDDARHVLDAIRMIRGVAEVTPVLADVGQQIAETRARAEIRERLYKALDYD